nr:hypothetical protein [Tanacetum cinerariifolium]
NPQHALKDKEVIDSGCSRHMTGNMFYLSKFEELNGGYITFGGNPKGGKISRKCKIRIGKLDFDDVYFVKELKFNLFSVSQMYDKKNSVLFIDTECLVLSLEFKLPDENQVLLRVPRENNMRSVDLKNIIPSRDLTCLFAKATLDESNLWHRRLGHINFKTLNKLVKCNLVRGLPSKVFKNDHTFVACKKGKQHRASFKTKPISSVNQPLQRLHVDLFGPTFVKSLNKKIYCLVVTDDYSRFTWVFFLATKEETSPILKTFITGIENQREFSVPRTPSTKCIAERKNRTLIEAARTMLADSLLPISFWAELVNTACYVQNRVLVTKPENTTPYELLHGRIPNIGFMRPFGCPVTILNILDSLGKFDGKVDKGFLVGYSVSSKAIPNIGFMRPFGCPVTILNILDSLGKFDGKVDKGFLVGYSVSSKAFRVFNSRTQIVQETLHINFLENKPNVAGSGPTWKFDIDTLTKTMNYQPVTAGNQSNPSIGVQEQFDVEKAGEENEPEFEGRKPESEVNGSPSSKFEDFSDNSINEDNNAGTLVPVVGQLSPNSTNTFSDVDPSNAAASPTHRKSSYVDYSQLSDDPNMLELEDITYSDDEDDVVKQKKDGTFISQDKYVAEILRKFGLTDRKSGSTPIDTEKPLIKDPDGEDVDVYTYILMIGSLMYLTSSRPDIMFAVCTCARFQVTPKASHLHAVKRIFRYLKGKPYLGLWYPKDSPFNLVAYSDSDYAGASLDRKSTTRGCQFLGCRLISWQCKKQTVVATSSTEAEYVAVASCCAQVL